MIYNSIGMLFFIILMLGTALIALVLSKALQNSTRFKNYADMATNYYNRAPFDTIKFAYMALMFTSILDITDVLTRTGIRGFDGIFAFVVASILLSFALFDVVIGFRYHHYLKSNEYYAQARERLE